MTNAPRQGRALTIIVRAALLLIQFVVLAVIARRFGQSVFADFLLVASAARFGQLFLEGGMPESLSVAVAETGASAARAAHDRLRQICLWSLPSAAGVAFTVASSERSIAAHIAAGLLLAVVRAVGRSVGESLRALGQAHWGAVLDGIGDVALFLPVVVMVPGSAAASTLVLLNAACAYLLVSIGLLLLRANSSEHQSGVFPSAWSADVVATRISQFGVSYIDLWIVALVADKAAVANYGVASRVAMVLALPLSMANQLQIRDLILVGRRQVGSRQAWARLVRLNREAAGVTGVLFVALVLLGPVALPAIFGGEFGDSAGLLAFLAIGQLVNALTGPCVLALIYARRARDARRMSLTAAAVGILAGTTLGILFGVTGVAAGFALGVVLQNVLASITTLQKDDALHLVLRPMAPRGLS